MTHKEKAQQLKQSLPDAGQEQILKALIEYLEPKSKFGIEKQWYQDAILLQNRLLKLAQEDRRGKLSFDENNKESNRISSDLIELLTEMEDPWFVRLKKQVIGRKGAAPPWAKVVAGMFALVIFSVLGWQIYYHYIPKGNVDKSICWVATKYHFADLEEKPQSVSQPIADLPGNKKYQVLEVKEVPFFNLKTEKFYRIEEGDFEGWIRQSNLKDFCENCKDCEPKSTIDKSKCWVRASMMAEMNAEPKLFVSKIGELENGKEYEVLDKAQYHHGSLQTFNFYKIHDSQTGLTGWVNQEDFSHVDPKCYE